MGNVGVGVVDVVGRPAQVGPSIWSPGQLAGVCRTRAGHGAHPDSLQFFTSLWPHLDSRIHSKFHYAKRKFFITSKYRHIYEVLNVDEIKN
jgi:hypothetical protein